MMNYRFKKKPVGEHQIGPGGVIEAFQMTPETRIHNVDWPEWLNRAWNFERNELGSVYPTVKGTGDGTLSIRTLEGEQLVSWNDWIIFGTMGEMYPCNPEVFKKIYEAVE